MNSDMTIVAGEQSDETVNCLHSTYMFELAINRPSLFLLLFQIFLTFSASERLR